MKIVAASCLLYLLQQWSFAQCSLAPQLTIPVVDRSVSNSYAAASDSFGEFMIIAEAHNDSLDYNAGIVHLYQLTAGKWVRIAILTPSDPQESMHFGFFLTMNASTICIIGNRYDVDGNSREKIYVYEQDNNGKWNSGTESYQIEVSTATLQYVRSIDLSSNYLAVGFEEQFRDNKVAIYRHDGGQFSFVQNIDGPRDVDGSNRYFAEHISLTDDLLVVSSTSHKNDPNSFYNFGRVFLYERTGATWTSHPVAILGPSDRNAFIDIQFGRDVQIAGTSVLVAAHQNVANANSKNTIYVYNKPPPGWSGDLIEVSQIPNGENGYQYWDMVTDGDYLFLPNIDWTAITVHKRTAATWANHSMVQTIVLPVWAGDNWGRSMTITGSHFAVGLGAGPDKTSSDGRVVDYLPNPQWENGIALNQQFNETSVNATMDEYGKDVAVNQNWMAVSAVGDDDNGEYSGAVYLYERNATGWIQKEKIKAHDGKPFMFFGQAIALSSDRLFVGAAWRHSYNGDGSISVREPGAVYVYKKSGGSWQFDEMISPPNPKIGGRFGQEITWSNGYIAVSEFTENGTGSLGYVHVFKEDAGGWIRIATLTPSNHGITETFGRSIAMNDSIIVVGTGSVQFHNNNSMKVYVFKKKGEWKSATEDARLFPDQQSYGDRFGFSVALHGDQIVVGAPGFSEGFQIDDAYKGAAYIFLKPATGWSNDIHQTARLSARDALRHAAFGTSVAIDEDDVYVGAPHNYFVWNVVDNLNNDDGQLNRGTVYHYYKKNGWITTEQEDEQLHSIQPEIKDMFGIALVLHDGFLSIGAVFDDTSVGHKSGSVLTFPQLPLITSVVAPCVEDGLVSLNAIPWGGAWKINGYPSQVDNTIQLPAGSYTATYEVEGCHANPIPFEVISSGRVTSALSPAEKEKCFYESVSLYLRSNAPLQDYQWFYKPTETDDLVMVNNGVDGITVTESGHYYVAISHPICNPIMESFRVLNEAQPDVMITKPAVICAEAAVLLSASPSGGVWSTPANTSGEIQPAALVNGEYLVAYTHKTPLGCEFSDEETIIIDKLVKPEIMSSSKHVCTNQAVTLTLLNKVAGSSATWFADDRPGVALSSEDNMNVTESGSYFVTVSNHGCSVASDVVLLETKPDSVFIPNVITPNGDSKNEFFEMFSEGVSHIRLIILNRFGDRVFTSSDPTFHWDASNVSNGIYYWYVQYTACSNRRRELKGIVHVLHD